MFSLLFLLGFTMSKTQIREDENLVFGINIKQNNVLTDIQGGVASLTGKVFTVVRDGDTIELDATAGVTFSAVGPTGVYDATFDRSALLDSTGAAFIPQVGDDFTFISNAEVVAGEPPIEGVPDFVCIVAADVVPNPTDGWSNC